MPCFKSIGFYHKTSQVNLFLQKNSKALSAGDGGPKSSKQPPPHCKFVATCLSEHFLLVFNSKSAEYFEEKNFFQTVPQIY